MIPSIDSDILKYLTNGANVRFALEIAKYAERIKQEVVKDFWDKLYDAVRQARPVDSNSSQFTFIPPGSTYTEYARIWAFSFDVAKQSQKLGFAIEHESNGRHYNLYIGLRWSLETATSDSVYEKPPLRDLKLQFDAAGSDRFGASWVGYRFAHRFESLEEFVCTYVENPRAIVDTTTAAFWSLVEHHLEALNEVNRLFAAR